MAAPDICVKSYAPLDAPSAGGGKFVLLEGGGGHLHLVLSPVDLTPYHAHIVERYLGELGVRVEMRRGPTCRVLDPGWTVLGGGYYSVSPVKARLAFYGRSTAFGKYPRIRLAPHMRDLPARLGLPEFALELE